MSSTVEKLMDQASECLHRNEIEDALKIGKELIVQKFSGGFEILALAYSKNEEIDKAIETLEEGVEACPTVWLLWQLLGNMHSDNGEQDKAYDCYKIALNCPNTWRESVLLNKAIALAREDRFEDSNKILLEADDDEIRLEIESVRLSNLNAMEKYDEVVQTLSIIKAEILSDITYCETNNPVSVSRILAEIAWAYLRGFDKPILAREYVFQSLYFDRENFKALDIVRMLNNEKSVDSKYYRIITEGQVDIDSEILGFFCHYEVVSSSELEALRYIGEIETQEIRESIKIDEIEVLSDCSNALKGVWKRAPLHCFPLDSEE